MLSTSVSSGRGIGSPYVSLGVPNSASCLFLVCSALVSLANPESRISFSLRRSSFSLKSVRTSASARSRASCISSSFLPGSAAQCVSPTLAAEPPMRYVAAGHWILEGDLFTLPVPQDVKAHFPLVLGGVVRGGVTAED